MKAVILAGGEGSRLRPVTCTVAKPMLSLLGKPILGYIIEHLKKNGFDEIVVTTRYRSEDIESYIESLEDNEIYCLKEESVLGTAGSVKNAAKKWNEPFLVIDGDCITDINIQKVMLYHKSIMADVTIVCSTVENPCDYGNVNLNRNGSVESLCEKPDWSHTSSDLANTGIYIVNPALLDMIPENVQYDFSVHLFPDMMNEGKRLFGYQTTDYWNDITDIKDYRNCIKDIMNHKVNISVPESKNGVFVADKLPNGDFDIVPPVYIGKNVRVGMNCVIGPYTVLEDNVTVSDNTRIKKSVVGRNATVGNNCDFIGSVIGEKCVIKANTVCLEGSCIGDETIINSGSTISNNVLIWPSKIIPYRSVLTKNLRDGFNEYDLLEDDSICGVTFSELSCERCCRLGEAIASSSCGGRIAIGYDRSKASKALGMALLSGLISGGSVIYDFGECFESQTAFFVSHCALDCGIYITATPKKSQIRLFGAFGLPLSRKYEREIESRYKRSDFRRCSGVECNEIIDMSSLGEVYEGQLLSLAGDCLSGASGNITSPNPMIRQSAEKCFFLSGCRTAQFPSFSVDYSGKNVTAKDENGSFITKDKLFLIAAINEIESGNDICIPFDAPVMIDNYNKENKVTVYRAGKSSMHNYPDNMISSAGRCMWAFDGLALAFRIMGIINKKKKPLCQLADEIKEPCIVSRVVASSVPHYRIASVLGLTVDNDSEGIRKFTENGTVTITRTGAGRLLRIVAEAANIEAATELCDFTQHKITDDTIDIYHQ
ncbi:MAG: NTP transferase domain-containing protein [Clostridia bacterium]|nr:NTP transferase domain-containing protein [Clostridia bacterium]